MNSSPEYQVPALHHDPQPPSSGQVFRYILLCLFTIVIVYFNVVIIGLIRQELTQHGLRIALLHARKQIEAPFVLALLPLGVMCLTLVCLDRHSVLHPRMASSRAARLVYRVLLGWILFMVLLGLSAVFSAY
jgi:hypothetical protein